MDKKSFLGEFLGTFVLTLFGCACVACAVLFGEYSGVFQVGLAWGLGVTLAIYLTRYLSCAHLNPAVSIAMVVAGRMKARKLPAYLAAQLLGAVVAGLVLYALFSPSIAHYEELHGLVRGSAASVDTARMFGEFYPNPGNSVAVVTLPLAMAAECFGTFLLVLFIFMLTEGCNVGRPSEPLQPVFIGLTVASVIFFIAPLTQAGLNPARDVGPRIVACLCGWGAAALPDRVGGWFWVYVLGPIAGGCLAALFYRFVVEKALLEKNREDCSCAACRAASGDPRREAQKEEAKGRAST